MRHTKLVTLRGVYAVPVCWAKTHSQLLELLLDLLEAGFKFEEGDPFSDTLKKSMQRRVYDFRAWERPTKRERKLEREKKKTAKH